MKFTFAPESRPLDGYTIKRAIYRGGFGEVYYALTDAGREVALKLLQNNSEIELRGVQQCLNLSHPNLVTIFDVKQDRDGDHWIIMEYVAGETLDMAIHRHPNGMPMEEVRKWLRGIADGVEFLHDQGIVHRDLKPGNVFSEANVVKIGDVGLSKFITPSRRSAQTQSVGTVYYMAPEVAKGRYGMEVDVYALGIILYEMITGRVPFEGESTGEILMKHLSEKPDLTKLPERVRPVIDIALQKDPKQRFSTVRELHEAFEAAIIGTYTPSPREATFTASQEQSPVKPGGQFAPTPGRQRVSHLDETTHFHSNGNEISNDDSLWWPTKRAFLWMLAIGTATLILGEGRRAEGVQIAMCGSALSYVAYTLLRRRQSDSAKSILTFIDKKSLPLGYGGNHWWILGLLGWLGANTVIADANFGDVAESLLPIGAAWWFIGYIAHKTVPELMRGPWKELHAEAVSTGQASRPPAPGPASRPVERRDIPVARPVKPMHRVRPVGKHYYRNQPVTPAFARPVSFRTRMTHFTTSATLIVPIIALLTGGVFLVAPEFFATGASEGPGWENMGLFAGTATIASWMLMGLNKWNEGRRVDGSTRRFLQFVAGAVVGLAAYGLSEGLLIGTEVPADVYDGSLWSQADDPMFVAVGGRPLFEENGLPTLLGFAGFFAGLFGLRRWWWHTDSFRQKRFRVGSVLLTVCMAWLVSSVWAFPPIWAMTWAAVISSGVQLASVWTPSEERFVAREV
ncbi:MAG: serine/threonine protein kinase [Planctomycetaceae bacterium]|nr:serine/threonine protein kinase [Planctomycetaceae bacterium]